MRKIVIILTAIMLLSSCQLRNNERLIVGIIAPSLNHLPIDVGIRSGIISQEDITLINFSSGWEANEALVAEKIDVAILPFTYIWSDVARGKKVKIISFFERESDGLITRKEIGEISELNGKKIGVLRASTLDIFVEMLAEKHQIKAELVYFRTPIEMAAALNSYEVDALSFYVPSIFRFDSNYHIIHWYGTDFPEHPCCDVAATETALQQKETLIRNFLNQLQLSINKLNLNPELSFATAQIQFLLSKEITQQSINHTRYNLILDEVGKEFESEAIEMMKKKKYITNPVTAEDVFWNFVK